MKKAICSFAALVLMFTAEAQNKIPFFLRAEIGSSNVKSNLGKAKAQLSFGVGVETFLPIIEDKLMLNPNLSFLKTGYKTVVGGKINVNYISLGMPFCFSILRNSDGFIGVGPFVNVAMGGRFKEQASDKYRKINFGNTIDDNRKLIDAGIVFETAVNLDVFLLGVKYNMGLKDLTPEDRKVDGTYIKSQNLLFYVSIHL